jgi:hypothetical protein
VTLTAHEGWQRAVNWRQKFPDERMELQGGSLGISFLIFVILAVGVFAWVTR